MKTLYKGHTILNKFNVTNIFLFLYVFYMGCDAEFRVIKFSSTFLFFSFIYKKGSLVLLGLCIVCPLLYHSPVFEGLTVEFNYIKLGIPIAYYIKFWLFHMKFNFGPRIHYFCCIFIVVKIWIYSFGIVGLTLQLLHNTLAAVMSIAFCGQCRKIFS